jgi:hypothetical protein
VSKRIIVLAVYYTYLISYLALLINELLPCFIYHSVSLQYISYFYLALYSSPNIIRMIKSRRIRRAGHAARMGRRGMHAGYWWESQKERDH